MSAPVEGRATASSPSDVIRRVVKAWIGAYDLSIESFAIGVGMNPRTLARRLAKSGAGRNFPADEVARMADYMSRFLPEPVTMDDVYAGRVNLGSAWAPSDWVRRQGLEPRTR